LAQKEKHIKTVYLVRHAKAENQDIKKPDHDRALIEKGIKNAEKLGKMVAGFRFPPEAIYTSSARRAHDTATIFADALKIPDKVTVDESLYSASHQIYLQQIQKLPDELRSVMLVGHNPVLEDLLTTLTARSPFHCKMPTCALASVHFHVTLWSEIRPATGILRVLLYPKLFVD
jgi:phosphohistidine phosphatase